MTPFNVLVLSGALTVLAIVCMVASAILTSGLFRDGPPPKGTRWSLYRHHLGNYMHRWIFLTPFGTLRLHHILRSDEDEHLHDHPFDFTSFLLSGGYVEEIPLRLPSGDDSNRVRLKWRRFSIVRKKAEDAHRLIVDKPLWTFVVSGSKRRDWGFHTEKGWILHSDYFKHFPEVIDRRLGSTEWRRTGL